ncbi:tRNA (guanosine(37)-N1)-methyltransferase TrmD [Dethiobacter alkaliphilus]|uniref:tRNA (guanine-N(1)-)-methyltransferase n=1 Tax=Dethiobacter alkaliphilus AHT 1 TaxID=555088 RepID=C0GHM0_DETAL|nr:tRNA (guanosine(37)-N1)-methyltransferase TrmD [Dethiobacter alkaliphilus]EEG77226.1 tRNA (guanine-N1)-methyltransferase [Dethiobacter alkaliphilus AHT 1]MCW3489946.1 tRNA (guanosine(37)-N1)-methyltransferase TrmD [Dethiobacter alkaliphilus]
MRIDIITIFPGMFASLQESIIRRAVEAGHVQIEITDLRAYANNKHRSVDDYPYGGGPGMVMQPEPFFLAVEHLQKQDERQGPVILLTPGGETFTQKKARELASRERITLLCGHYEGIDERVRETLVDEEISLGDFVLTGGEIPAMAITDAVVRLLPGVLPEESVTDESFTDGLLEYPQYTRPAEFRGLKVPEVLLSGNHEKIRLWRRQQSLLRTLACRPDLLAQARLSPEEKRMLDKMSTGNDEGS